MTLTTAQNIIFLFQVINVSNKSLAVVVIYFCYRSLTSTLACPWYSHLALSSRLLEEDHWRWRTGVNRCLLKGFDLSLSALIHLSLSHPAVALLPLPHCHSGGISVLQTYLWTSWALTLTMLILCLQLIKLWWMFASDRFEYKMTFLSFLSNCNWPGRWLSLMSFWQSCLITKYSTVISNDHD